VCNFCEIKLNYIGVAFYFWHAVLTSACVHTACSVGTFLPVLLGATPMYISRHTWHLSPSITLYCVPPTPPLILVPVTALCPCDSTSPCSVVCEQALRKVLLLDIPVAYLVVVKCCGLWGTTPWRLLEPQTWLGMEATIPLYILKTTRRKYNLVLECSRSSFVCNL